MHRNGAVGNGGDDLPQLFRPHIAYGINTGDGGLGGLICQDIAILIQRQLPGKQLRCRHSSDAD